MTILVLVIVEIYESKERGHFPSPSLQSYKVSQNPSRNRIKIQKINFFKLKNIFLKFCFLSNLLLKFGEKFWYEKVS